MERIKEAVEKARAGQSAGINVGRKNIEVPAFSRGQPSADLESITYTQTRVVSLDPRHLEANRIIAANKNDARAMAFDILRTKILGAMGTNQWKTIAITSPRPDCGKSIVAINLAISLARQTDHTVLLADFDLRRPRLGAYLGLPQEDALVECIEGRRELKDALINPGIPRLVVLTNSSGMTHASELLSSQKVKDLVMELRQRYERRILIFDLPPVLTADDTMAFLPQVDCALLVVASGATTKSEVEESERLLTSTNLLGVVLNKAEDYQQPYY